MKIPFVSRGRPRRGAARPCFRRFRSEKLHVEDLESRCLLSLNQFPLLTPAAAPAGIAVGPDGALWFTERAVGQLGRVTIGGTVTEYETLSSQSSPAELTAGSDGALWFTEPGSNRIGRLTTAGAMTEYPLPTPAADPEGIALGPDGAVWFTERAADQIGRIDPAGQIAEYPAPWERITGSGFQGIVTGPDGALWFTEQTAHAIGRVTTDGVFQEFALPSGGDPYAIAAGPDGALWFTEQYYTQVGRIDTTGKVTEFGRHALNSFYGDITAGPDGALWFLVNNTIGLPQLGRIKPNGHERFIALPTSFPLGDVTTGPDGNIWFAETGGDAIGQWVVHSQQAADDRDGGRVGPPMADPVTDALALTGVLDSVDFLRSVEYNPSPPAAISGEDGSVTLGQITGVAGLVLRSGDQPQLGSADLSAVMDEGIASGVPVTSAEVLP